MKSLMIFQFDSIILRQSKSSLTEGHSGGALAINASFGMGKSFFCKRYSEYLEKEYNYNCFVLNLFLYDSHSEPLAIVTQTLDQITKDESELRNKLIETTKLLLETAKCFVPTPFRLIADEATNFLFSKEAKTLDKQVEEYKDALKQLAKKRPIVIFIDELDRAKPDFALLFLERLKHYFDSIPGLLFILMINQKRLEEIIKHSYGVANAPEYLEKFLCHHIIDLHTENYQTRTDPYKSGLEHSLFQKLLDSDKINTKFIQTLAHFAKIMKLTLREIVKLSNRIKGKIEKGIFDPNSIKGQYNLELTSYFLPLTLKYPEIVKEIIKSPTAGFADAYQLLEKLTSESCDTNNTNTKNVILCLKAASNDSSAIKEFKAQYNLNNITDEQCAIQEREQANNLLKDSYK